MANNFSVSPNGKIGTVYTFLVRTCDDIISAKIEIVISCMHVTVLENTLAVVDISFIHNFKLAGAYNCSQLY